MRTYLVVYQDVVGGDAHLPRVNVLVEDNAPRGHLQVGALYACACTFRHIRFLVIGGQSTKSQRSFFPLCCVCQQCVPWFDREEAACLLF